MATKQLKEETMKKAAPKVMLGGDYYNRHSQYQLNAMRFGLPLLKRAVQAIPLPCSGDAIVVADYGSSEGRNSIRVMGEAVRLIRRRAPEPAPIVIVHNDQPGNDFRTLFTHVDKDPDSYLHKSRQVFAFASGRSFFERVFPPRQVLLGWSSIAIHWLSRAPAPIPGHIWNLRAPARVRRVWAGQARLDWQHFLEHRAHELRPGGSLVILGRAADSRGCSGAEGLVDRLNAVLRQAVRRGMIRSAEYARMSLPTYNRRRDEFEAPFAAGMLGGILKLEEYRQVVLPDPSWIRYRQSRDAKAYARDRVGFLRATTENSLFSSLDPDRTADDRRRLADDCYASLESGIASGPSGTQCRWQLALMRMIRRS
jgi:hypothetical protein